MAVPNVTPTSGNLIVTDALQKLGVYAPGEIISDADASRGLQLLNDMIDQWSDDSIFLYQLTTIAASLVNATNSYTVGSGATINTPRPLRAVMGPAIATVTNSGVTTNVNSISALEWNALYAAPGLTGASGLTGVPLFMFYDPQFPWGVLNVAPTPNASMTLNFSGLYGFTAFPLLSTTFVMSEGQELALVTNLAVLYNTYFGVGPPSPELMAEAQHTKTLLTLTNRLSRAMSRRNVQAQVPVVAR